MIVCVYRKVSSLVTITYLSTRCVQGSYFLELLGFLLGFAGINGPPPGGAKRALSCFGRDFFIERISDFPGFPMRLFRAGSIKRIRPKRSRA